MVLMPCTQLWGRSEVSADLPSIRRLDEAIYLPFASEKPWGLYDTNRQIVEEGVDYRGPERTLSGQITAFQAEGIPTQSVERGFLYIGRMNPHYGHFIVNSLSRMWPLTNGDFSGLRFLCHGDPLQLETTIFAKRIFGQLGIDLSRLVFFSEPTLLKDVVVPETSFKEQYRIHCVFKELSSNIGAGLWDATCSDQPVYLSKTRLKQGAGRFANEKEIEEILEASGIEIAYPETLSFDQQIKLISSRSLVVGSTGSAFHSAAFAAPGRRFLCLNQTPEINTNYLMLDELFGVEASYYYAPGTTHTLHQDGFWTNRYAPNPTAIAYELLDMIEESTGWARRLSNKAPTTEGAAKLGPSFVPNAKKGRRAMSLYTDLRNNTGRPIHKMMHYVVAYERHFGHLVGRPCNFLEIGVGNGGSSQMFKKWLGPLAQIVSIDLNPKCMEFQDEQVAVRIGDQANSEFLGSLVEEFGPFDAVLDDGSHQASHIMASLHFLFPRIAPTGVYMIEDVHTAYWNDYGGSGTAQDTIVAFAKEMIDKLNLDHIPQHERAIDEDVYSKNCFSMSVYDSVIVFEKSSFANKKNMLIGDDKKRRIY